MHRDTSGNEDQTSSQHNTMLDKTREAWRTSDSMVCVGLDPDPTRIPAHLLDADHPYFEFCRAIIDATAEYACAFKPQFAHFAAAGREADLALVFAYLNDRYPDRLAILDAKRGDIGSTARMYALEAFERYGADAVTVNPYLGKESLDPYLEYPGRGVIVLCRTSNPDSVWMQGELSADAVFMKVARAVQDWQAGQFMLVTGATYPKELGAIREVAPDVPFLVPGIGAQGGDLSAVLQHGLDRSGRGLLISSSRGIIYAQGEGDFQQNAAAAAAELKQQIHELSNS